MIKGLDQHFVFPKP